MIECKNCGCQLDDCAKFCLECGSPVVVEEIVEETAPTSCPNCNQPIDENMKFCMSCGLNLSQLASTGPSNPKF